jgi:oxalate decarboxylase/phosphoglucose isomerase-like protein (cupin superfamily)
MNEVYIDEGCFILELSNTPDDPAVSIARARVPRGVTTRWHRVKDTAERYVVFIPPSARQRIANIGDTDLIFLAICTPRFVPAAYEAAER